MACFTIPLAGAAIAAGAGKLESVRRSRNPFLAKLPWLVKLGLGGSFLLAIEHIYHGEVVLYPPFLTAMNDPADTQAMLHEIATTGVSMAALLVAVWAGMVVVSTILEHGEKRSAAHV